MAHRRVGTAVRRALVGSAVVVLAMAGTAPAVAQEQGGDASPEVKREILVQSAPAQAPGFELYLVRVTIPPGGRIAPHTHPGTQGAQIQRGTLSYTLISGSADIVRPSPSGDLPEVETVGAPTTVKLRPKETVIENPTLVHEAENKGKTPVVILLTALFPVGAPLSEPASGQ